MCITPSLSLECARYPPSHLLFFTHSHSARTLRLYTFPKYICFHRHIHREDSIFPTPSAHSESNSPSPISNLLSAGKAARGPFFSLPLSCQELACSVLFYLPEHILPLRQVARCCRISVLPVSLRARLLDAVCARVGAGKIAAGTLLSFLVSCVIGDAHKSGKAFCRSWISLGRHAQCHSTCFCVSYLCEEIC